MEVAVSAELLVHELLPNKQEFYFIRNDLKNFLTSFHPNKIYI